MSSQIAFFRKSLTTAITLEISFTSFKTDIFLGIYAGFVAFNHRKQTVCIGGCTSLRLSC